MPLGVKNVLFYLLLIYKVVFPRTVIGFCKRNFTILDKILKIKNNQYVSWKQMRRVNFSHPQNQAILAYLTDPSRRDNPNTKNECDPALIPRAYETLGTHPDLVARLWDELGGTLKVDCRWVVYGAPTLVRVSSGIIFGYASGTHTYMLKLPLDLYHEVREKGAKTQHKFPAFQKLGIPERILDLEKIELGWVLGSWSKAEVMWCQEAYAAAI